MLLTGAQEAGVAVKLIAPQVGGVTLSDGTALAADEKIAGAPSVLFDAVALLLGQGQALKLCTNKAAVDFVADAYGHLKAIGHDGGAQPVRDLVGVPGVKGVFGIKMGEDLLGKVAMRFCERRHQVDGMA